MQFFTTIALAMGIATQASAFTMDVWNNNNCGGKPDSNVNVWDNTCARTPGFQSYKVTSFGGSHQHAYFFVTGGCGDLGSGVDKEWMDGGDPSIGQCMQLTGHSINAVASYRG